MRRFKDFILKDKKFLREVAIILIVGIIINALCFLMPLVVHAENVYYPVESGVNSPLGAFTVEELLDLCDSYSSLPDDYYYVIRVTASPNSYYPLNARYDVCVFSKSIVTDNASLFPLYIEVSNNGYFTFYLNSLYTNDRYNVKFYYLQSYNGNTSDLQLRGGTINNLSANSPLVDDKTTYYFNISVPKDYVTNTEYVLKYNESINIGDFTNLPNIDEILDDLSNSYEQPSSLTGHALPSQPTENPNNTPFEDRLQMFDYLKDVLTALFGNLGYNISNWLNSLGSKIVQGFNSVSQNIWNGFSTLMSNFQGFFAPKLDYIIERLNYITEPLDQEEINVFIESSDIYIDVSSIQTSVSDFTGSLTGVNEPNSYSITLHIEDIGILHQEQPYILSFDILNDVKPYIRGFLWCFCTYGLFISIVDSFANYINGGGGEDD